MANFKILLTAILIMVYISGNAQWDIKLANPKYGKGCLVNGTQTGFVIGTGGCIRKTTDNGASWQWLNPGIILFESDAVFFPDVNHGWVAGYNGKIIMTSDGGNTWIEQQ